jgi:hypothetical protein
MTVVAAKPDVTREAVAVLRENDRGSYTVPTKGLYPFQWNWDSCFTALGLSHFDMPRAWTEIETPFARQWDDGMVPHMVFHEPAPGYYWRGPVWHVCDDLIVANSLALIEQSGFAEYYNPRDGAPLGGGRFSWTAAMVLEFADPIR